MSKRRKINPQNVPQKLNEQQVIHEKLSVSSWSGPLPDPNSIEHYSKLYPKAAEIIFNQFESESNHRQAIEKRTVNLETFTVVFVAIILSAFFIAGTIALFTIGWKPAALLLSPTIIAALINIIRKK